jgi:hypothetical protein
MLGIQTDEKGLREYLEKEKPFAEIRQIILHHTYRPTTEQYKGLATIQGIWQYHTKTCGWSDIGYHLLAGPEGAIWLGRPIDREGAHAKGQNGDSIGISMIGDFDDEKLGEKQSLATTAALRALLERYELSANAINFHRDYSRKTCPGSKINKQEVRQWVAPQSKVKVFFQGKELTGVKAQVGETGRVEGALAELAKVLRPEIQVAWDNGKKRLDLR